MSTEQLSMSMSANRSDYDAAVQAQAEQLPDGLQLAIELIEPESEDAACDRWVESERPHGDAEAVQRQWEESRQLRWVRQANRAAAAIHATHMAHAAALARIAELEAERDEQRRLFIQACEALADLGTKLGLDDDENDPPAIFDAIEELQAERDELRARLASIEAQDPVGIQHRTLLDGEWSDWRECVWWRTANILRQREDYEVRHVYARPVPAQAAPAGERQAVLLTDEQVAAMIAQHWGCADIAPQSVCGFARSIEAASLAVNNPEARRG